MCVLFVGMSTTLDVTTLDSHQVLFGMIPHRVRELACLVYSHLPLCPAYEIATNHCMQDSLLMHLVSHLMAEQSRDIVHRSISCKPQPHIISLLAPCTRRHVWYLTTNSSTLLDYTTPAAAARGGPSTPATPTRMGSPQPPQQQGALPSRLYQAPDQVTGRTERPSSTTSSRPHGAVQATPRGGTTDDSCCWCSSGWGWG
jgi:hypothetical protein